MQHAAIFVAEIKTYSLIDMLAGSTSDQFYCNRNHMVKKELILYLLSVSGHLVASFVI